MTRGNSQNHTPVILYEDADLLLVNKPSGLLSVPDGYDPGLPHLKSVLEPDYGKLWIVHRLDKDTSGILLIARNADSHRVLNEHFRSRNIEKNYHGLVTPRPSWQELDIQLPLLVNADRKHRTRVNIKTGKEAHTYCQVKKWFKMGALLEIQIYTGISHQIRAHLRANDLVLLGDNLYQGGLQAQPFTVLRTMLHARQLGFAHPTSGKWTKVSAPYPDDFRAAYTNLKLTTTQHLSL